MRKAIIRKIKSRKGASLSIAMLLFMVCAVVGGIILAAATAAGGRVNELAEADKRYYSVTSAAELLAEAISGKEITIEQTMTIYTNAAGERVKSNGAPWSADDEDPVAKISVIDGMTDVSKEENLSFLAFEAEKLLRANGLKIDETSDSDKRLWYYSYSACDGYDPSSEAGSVMVDGSDKTFKIGLYNASNNKLGSDVACSGYVEKDGTLVINVTGSSADDDTPPSASEHLYSLNIIMKPTYSETQIDETGDMVPKYVEASGSTEYITEKAVTISSTISWYLSSIEKA